MIALSLLFVGITLVSNGALTLMNVDRKSIALMNIITAIVLVGGNFVALTNAQTMLDFSNVGGGFLFGFTYAIIAANLLFGLDGKAAGMFSIMVSIFAIIMGIDALQAGDVPFAILWFAWAFLWSTTFIENVLKKPLGKFLPVLCILEGIFAAFIPSMLMFFEMW